MPPQQAVPPAVDSDSDGDADEYVEATEFTTHSKLPPAKVPPGGEGESVMVGGREG